MAKPANFGAFCRARRNALGLSLREFCRRNGLDAGNVSRMERGLLSPPQTRQALEEYAAALKVAIGSADWQRLLDLAAAETGRIPVDLADDPSAIQGMPSAFRELRGVVRPARAWTSAIILQSWADSRAAQEDLPRLVRRLIHADNTTIRKIELAAGEGIGRRGFDALVVADTGSTYVPQGISVWEMGVGRDPARKANDDYRKRTAKSLGVDKSEVAFVFCTPRRWEDKEAWEQKKRGSGEWKDVRVYDADNFEAWLERAPAVDAWFSRRIGWRPEGVETIDEYWSNLSRLTEPSLLPAVFLASRDEEAESIRKWFEEPASSRAYQANTPADVIDFLAACIAGRDEQEREYWAARVVVVERREAWESLVDSPQKLVLVPRPSLPLESQQVGRAVQHGHHVLVAANRFTGGGFSSAKLPRPNRFDLEKALVDSGFDESKAEQLARECRGSLAVLKRRLPQQPGTSRPQWAQGDWAQKLASFLLIGSWDDSLAGDRSIVEHLTGRSYAEVLDEVQRWAASEDAPFVRLLSCWSLTSHEDAWYLLAAHLRPDQVEKFQTAALTVLSAQDPALDLPADERWKAQTLGAVPAYSAALRNGVAETLVLLAARSTDGMIGTIPTDSLADRVVRRLLGNGPDQRLWASVSDHLPALAEASPRAFLDALSADLNSRSPQTPRLFETGGADSDISPCLHAGLLWALETLAWSPKHLTRVTLTLARLAEFDTERSRWVNRPKNSLAEIFVPWRPQTSATIEQRLAALGKLRDEHPGVAWKLLLDLLPHRRMSSTPTPRPKWREWALDWSPGVTNAEYWRQVETWSEWLLEMVGADATRWIDLIEALNNFSPAHRTGLLQRLDSLDTSRLDPDERRRLTDAIRKAVALHTKHSGANWAISPEELEQLKRALARIESSDVVLRTAWLFDSWPRLLDEADRSYEENRKELAARRQTVLRELIRDYGFSFLIETFVEVVQSPWVVGCELARAEIGEYEERILPTWLGLTASKVSAFARGYAAGTLEIRGWNWVDSLPLREWTTDQTASLLLELPHDTRTWALVAKLKPDVCRAYWRNIELLATRDENDAPYAATMLLKHGRPFSAAVVLASTLYQRYRPPPALVMEVLLAGIGEREGENRRIEEPRGFSGAYLQELIGYLQRPDVECDVQQLARLEWAYLFLLDGHGGRPVTLVEEIRRKPEFFAQVLALIFRSEEEQEEPPAAAAEEEKKEEVIWRTTNAYRLLHSWNVLPGADPNTGAIAAVELENWVTEARRLCRQSGRIGVCDSQIGQMLSHAPAEPDGTWPCVTVRDVIDAVDTEDLRDGLVIGMLNRRGIHAKSPFEGGKQERELAEKCSRWAAACDAEWPVTASILRLVAEEYQRFARREDEAAESRRQR